MVYPTRGEVVQEIDFPVSHRIECPFCTRCNWEEGEEREERRAEGLEEDGKVNEEK